MEDNRNLLRSELGELDNFTRYHFQLFIGWYTFFLTVNFAAIGWFTSVLLVGQLKVRLPIILIGTFFVVQLGFSYAASVEVRRHFEATHARCCQILEFLDFVDKGTFHCQAAFSLTIYVQIIKLICATLATFMGFWILLSGLAIYLVPP